MIGYAIKASVLSQKGLDNSIPRSADGAKKLELLLRQFKQFKPASWSRSTESDEEEEGGGR